MRQENSESVETTRETPKRTFTIEHRQNLSDAMKGRVAWNKGLTKDDPRVLNYTLARINNPEYENYKIKLSKALMGHKSTFNKKHTQATRDKMSKWQLGRKHNYDVWNKGLTKKTSKKLRSISKNISKSLMLIPEERRK
jgi:hypothetical protein